MSVLPVVGSELPTDSDAALVGTVCVDDVMGDTLDAVGESVGRSCVRMDSGEAWPVLHDEHSVMSFLVRPAAVLTSQFFVWYDDGGDDCFSPVVGGCVPLTCPVDLDSLCMLPWNDRRKVETGSHAVMSHGHLGCRSFRIQTAWIGFCKVGRTYVLDLNIRETYPALSRLGAVLRQWLDFRLFRIAGWWKRCLIRSR